MLPLLLLAAGSVVLTAAARILVVRAQYTRPGNLGRPYGHTELSVLTQVRQRAVLASLGALRAAAAIDAFKWGAFHPEGPPPDEATAVDRAVYAAVARRASLVSINKDETVAAAIAAVEDELRAVGALQKEPNRRLNAWIRWPTMCAVLLGATVVPTVAYGTPVWLGPLLFFTGGPFLILATIAETDASQTRFGQRILQQAEARDLGTAVALHGVEALWAADGPFAERGRLPRKDPSAGSD